MTLVPLAFACTTRIFLAPRISLPVHFGVLWLASWSCSGLGLALSTLLPPSSSLLVGVLAPLILGGFLSGVEPRLCSYSYGPYARGRGNVCGS